MSYERLELINGVTKWDAEKVQHLENAIIKNEEDIQKYHNDTVVETQANWSQNDFTAPDYIIGRTHYPYKGKGEVIYLKEFEQPGRGQYPYVCDEVWEHMDSSPGYWMGDLVFYLGDNRLTSESDWQYLGTDESGNRKYRWESDGAWNDWAEVIVEYVRVERNRLTWTFGSDEDSWTFCKEKTLYSPLSEEYIPSSIARQAQVDSSVTSLENNIKTVEANLQQIEDCFTAYEDELLVEYFQNSAMPMGELICDLRYPIHLKFVDTSTGQTQIVKEDEVTFVTEEWAGEQYTSIRYDNMNGSIVEMFDIPDGSAGSTMACRGPSNPNNVVLYQLVPIEGEKKIDEQYISDTIARAPKAIFNDIEEAPTASDFNTLLSILRKSGILATG